MQCSSCKAELPAKAKHCPECGTVTPYQISQTGISPDAATSVRSFYGAPQSVSTEDSALPYEMPQQNADPPLNPYMIPSPLPPPLPRRIKRSGLMLIAIPFFIILLILASIGVLSLTKLVNINLSRQTSTPSVRTPQASPTTAISPNATGTPPYGNIPYAPFRGTLVLSDPLRDNSQGYGWQETNPGPRSCTFTDSAYHSKTGPGYYNPCSAQYTDFTNFAYEAQMTILVGDCGALLFRINNAMTNGYFFRVCQDGTYDLSLVTNNKSLLPLINNRSHAAIKAGLNQTNLLAIVANGPLLDLYVNQQHVNSISESTYSYGGIGVAAAGGLGHTTEVTFSNAQAWKL